LKPAYLFCIGWLFVAWPGACGSAGVPEGSEAQYYLNSAAEHQTVPVRRVRIKAGPVERVAGRRYQWWEMILEKAGPEAVNVEPGPRVFGIRVLSERVPMTGPGGVGDVVRYIYRPPDGGPLEYVNALTGRAALSEHSRFALDFFPQPAEFSRYTDGFADTGRLFGHTLVRYPARPFPSLDFQNPRVLRLREDLRIGWHVDAREDRDPSIPPQQREGRPLTREEYAELIQAGANYFHPQTPEAVGWVRDEPVFWNGPARFPEDFYRSNYTPADFYIDEPAIRFGWDGGIPGQLPGPEAFANAIQMRVEGLQRPDRRMMGMEGVHHSGAMFPVLDPCPSWETFLWTAAYQMAGGASALVFEGRYVRRGYGWAPELLLGEGLEGLDDRQQFDYFNSFLRGAARQWDREWGVSVYPEGDPDLMVPAFIRAYDQGARNFWFWGGPGLEYTQRVRVLRGLKAHIEAHPRPSSRRERNALAEAAIVLPAGFIPNENGIFGVPREARTSSGGSYADIAAAATFYGILLSRQGVEYDTVFARPDPERLAYRRLVRIREDGSADLSRSGLPDALPGSLSLEINGSPALEAVSGLARLAGPRTLAEERPGLGADPGKAASPLKADASQHPVRPVPRVSNITVDGDLSDWRDVPWTDISDERHIQADNWFLDLQLVVPEDAAGLRPERALGMQWDGITPEYRETYMLDGHHPDEVVITSVEPGSAASRAGIREGDVLLRIGGRKIRWAFELWGEIDRLKKNAGASVPVRVRRGGRDRHGGPSDLSGRFAVGWDERFLYVAADITDDVHAQTMAPLDFWMNDSLQIGLDPVLAATDGYGETGHEIGLALDGRGRSVAVRWAGRRGQAVGPMRDVRAAVRRLDGRTVYEMAVPLEALTPLCPALWETVGLSVVVNDSDDGETRKARLELDPLAMTAGKKLHRFSLWRFQQPEGGPSGGAALFWGRRCLKPGGAAELTLAAAGRAGERFAVEAELSAMDNPRAPSLAARRVVEVAPQPAGFSLKARILATPGRYRLAVTVKDGTGKALAYESLPVYVYR